MSSATLPIVLPQVPAVASGVGLVLLVVFAVLSIFKEVRPGDRLTLVSLRAC